MIKKTNNRKRSPKRHVDLIGVDFATTATKVVRLKQTSDGVVLSGVDQLPAVDLDIASGRLELSRSMTSHYGCLCYSCPDSVIRMVNTPLAAGESELSDAKLRELLNVTDEYRPSAALINRGKGRLDSSFLAAAIPLKDVAVMLNMFPAGPPAPASLEVSGLAVITAFQHARGSECADEAVCLIEAGEANSSFVLMNKGVVQLVGKMNFGSRHLSAKLGEDLGVDEDLARSILGDRSINISASLSSVLAPFAKQISISKDFVERQQGCRVSKIYVSGGLSLLPAWQSEIGSMLHAEVIPWCPLENIKYDTETLSSEISEMTTRFAAAVGAALGGFEI